MANPAPHATIRIRVLNSQRQPLGGVVDVEVRGKETDAIIATKRADAAHDIEIHILNLRGEYRVNVIPADGMLTKSQVVGIPPSGLVTLEFVFDRPTAAASVRASAVPAAAAKIIAPAPHPVAPIAPTLPTAPAPTVPIAPIAPAPPTLPTAPAPTVPIAPIAPAPPTLPTAPAPTVPIAPIAPAPPTLPTAPAPTVPVAPIAPAPPTIPAPTIP